ncbi:hypothetical protein MNBD_GAMMA02-1160 [hydrothermal vent metagenome]|uniref:Lipoprotein n=1 Tax=hydrothermal vent metagenome TaxID=652676 RepID=A0A3B0WA48_9ZZZZ
MRILTVLFLIGLLVACNQTTLKSNDSSTTIAAKEVSFDTQDSSKDMALEFLLSVSAKDFMTHMPPEPLEFRGVKLGEIANSDGSTLFMLCGEFLVEETKGVFNWVDFATIKTDGYEQWLGAQAKGLCQQPAIVWNEEGNLSPLLQASMDTFR